MIRLGIAGFGLRSNGNRMRMREADPDVRVVGVADPNEARVRELRLRPEEQADVVFYPTLDQMVRKASLDALLVGTNCHLHAPYAIEAAQYDVPLFLEKPVAGSMDQAVALERAFEKSRCPVVMSFHLWAAPLTALTHQYLQEGSIGSPEQ